MGIPIQLGATGVTRRVFIRDATTGMGKTGLVYNTSGLAFAFAQNGDASATAITLVAGTAGTWTSGGFREVDATKAPGLYDLDLPDAVAAGTPREVALTWKGTGVLDDGDVFAITATDVLSGGFFDTPQSEMTALLSTIDGLTGAQMIQAMFQRQIGSASFNKTTKELTLYKDDGSVLGVLTMTDDGTTFTKPLG